MSAFSLYFQCTLYSYRMYAVIHCSPDGQQIKPVFFPNQLLYYFSRFLMQFQKLNNAVFTDFLHLIFVWFLTHFCRCFDAVSYVFQRNFESFQFIFIVFDLHSLHFSHATYTGILINNLVSNNVTNTDITHKKYIYLNAVYTVLKEKISVLSMQIDKGWPSFCVFCYSAS